MPEDDISLREHFSFAIAELDKRVDQRFEQNDKALQAALLAAKEAVAAALTAAKEAVDKAETAAGKRFEATNEFRGQLSDQAAQFMSREVADAQFRELRNLVSELQRRTDIAEGKLSGGRETNANLYAFVAGLSGLVAIAAFIFAVAHG